jgi:hypothetical protein
MVHLPFGIRLWLQLRSSYRRAVESPKNGTSPRERMPDNIETIGWVDVASPRFLEITSRCVGIFFPLCSEGQCGGVVTCMHAGLIPVISYESGVDVHDFGMILPDCSVAEIQNAVRRVSALPTSQLEQMAAELGNMPGRIIPARSSRRNIGQSLSISSQPQLRRRRVPNGWQMGLLCA